MRIAHPSTGEPPSPPCSMAAGGDFYQSLLRRCQNLEASHAKLSEKLRDLQKRQRFVTNDTFENDEENDGEGSDFPAIFSFRSPYKSLLESIGHALHVFRASSGEILYWNRSAESLYGWRDYEVVGRRCFTELLVPVEHYLSSQKITGQLLRTGEPWSGQFPLKKRSGKVFMALVTKSLLYENGELAGIIVVSSDAAVVNNIEVNNLIPPRNEGISQDREQGLNFKKIKWHSRPPIAPAPEIAASVSNLAAKVFAKLQIKGKKANEDVGSKRKSGTGGDNSPVRKESTSEPNSIGDTRKSRNDIFGKIDLKRGNSGGCDLDSPGIIEASKSNEYSGSSKSGNSLQKLCGHGNSKEAEEEGQGQGKQFPSSEGSIGDHGTPTEGVNESSSLVDCEIHWEDLHMGEEIGQGFYAIVYHGIWNGSDVAIKVYLKNEYSEGTLQDYKKEIDIMKRLRHPNVLLFMGAAYSQEKERLAIITEFLPRGSLFKTLHKNNQRFDIRRRVRMALDVARGMNYLHHRNPPIVHRDLKSSNLLVDKNWTVKVGDFGLSKLKNATFLTAKSGRGTPQWMAPEVLRNEPSNEKSDVYSYGVILWELMTESIPWNNLNPLQVVGIVGFMDRRLELPEKIEPQIASIIRDCWKSDPAQRPSFEEIIRSMSNLDSKMAPTQRSAGF